MVSKTTKKNKTSVNLNGSNRLIIIFLIITWVIIITGGAYFYTKMDIPQDKAINSEMEDIRQELANLKRHNMRYEEQLRRNNSDLSDVRKITEGFEKLVDNKRESQIEEEILLRLQSLESANQNGVNLQSEIATIFLALINLQKQIRSNSPYHAELGMLKTLTNNDEILSSLVTKIEDVLNNKIVRIQQLTEGFAKISLDVLKADIADAENNHWGVTKNFLKKFIVIRKTGNLEGESLESVISRAEFALQNNDFKQTLKELRNLPIYAQEYFKQWSVDLQKNIDLEMHFDKLESAVAAIVGRADEVDTELKQLILNPEAELNASKNIDGEAL